MAKEIETYVKLQVPAGQASPSPPVGSQMVTLRQLNRMRFFWKKMRKKIS